MRMTAEEFERERQYQTVRNTVRLIQEIWKNGGRKPAVYLAESS